MAGANTAAKSITMVTDPHCSRQLLTLAMARERTGLDLVSAREISFDHRHSYHEMEEDSESKSHRSARDQGIKYFCSIGYHVFPEGVGVRGTFALADFIALREHRIVFVEVLSDKNVKKATLEKKAQIQNHGELCFILFSGTKMTDLAPLVAQKRAIQSWADVLYCCLDGYAGNSIEQPRTATVAYNTTRDRGIRVALTFERSRRRLAVSMKFRTHLYENSAEMLNSHGIPGAYSVGSRSYRYECIFLDLFKEFARMLGARIKFTSGRPDLTAFRAMRRTSGLKMRDVEGRAIASLMSKYRGKPVANSWAWNHIPSSRDLPPEDVYGVFVLERSALERFDEILRIIKEYGLTPEYDLAEFPHTASDGDTGAYTTPHRE
jgi:hypothetical protein